MDQHKIGVFIAQKRKELNITQHQLASKLGITEQAVSKWENGKSLPDASIMIDLCELLEISVTDLLNGEESESNESIDSTDNNLTEERKQEEIYKKMQNSERSICFLSLIFLVVSLSVGIISVIMKLPFFYFWLCFAIGLFQFIFATISALKTEKVVAFFKCRKCGNKYITKRNNPINSRFSFCSKCGKMTLKRKAVSSFFAVFLALSLSLSIGAVSFSIPYYYSIPTTVYTPNFTEVPAYENIIDFSNEDIYVLNTIGDYLVPSAIRLSSATARYNCHSYAWYDQNTSSNNIWIDNPMPFVNDWSFEEISGPEVGSIILYCDGTTIIHSGIVTSVISGTPNGICEDANLVNVVSKWGYYGFYQHRGDECPYVSSYGGSATSVKYYRVHSHSYYDHFVQFNSMKHKSYCACNEFVYKPHIYYVTIDNSQAVCAYCGYTTDLSNLLSILNSSDSNYVYITKNGSFVLPDGTTVIYPEDIDNYQKGLLDFSISLRSSS